ncbi:hypothetical protein [Flavobacterium sp. I3-2]|uniref:hypothetical protein n=1 Tax=Flavobacterium sp. I3-2 TaxID=2748319 RepID=UPI0015AA0A91|nr:hypothetical protein [Flavobacterium sp. I3-2]
MKKEIERKGVKIFIISLLLIMSFNCYSQNKGNINQPNKYIKDTHLRSMLNFLVENNYYDEIGINYIYEHYLDANQGFFIAKNIGTEKLGIYSYHFFSSEAHAAEFIMLINKKADNILVLGYGDFNTNKSKLTFFLNNNILNAIDRDEALSVILKKLEQIYPNHG